MQNNADDSQQSHPPRGKRSCPQDGQPQGTWALSVPNTASVPFSGEGEKTDDFSPPFFKIFLFSCLWQVILGRTAGLLAGAGLLRLCQGAEPKPQPPPPENPAGMQQFGDVVPPHRCPRGLCIPPGGLPSLPPPALPPNLTPISTGKEG